MSAQPFVAYTSPPWSAAQEAADNARRDENYLTYLEMRSLGFVRDYFAPTFAKVAEAYRAAARSDEVKAEYVAAGYTHEEAATAAHLLLGHVDQDWMALLASRHAMEGQ